MSRYIDGPDYAAFARRVIRAAARHVEVPEDLADLVDLHRTLEDAIAQGVAELRALETPWSAIGEATGMTRQSAHERWHKTAAQLVTRERQRQVLPDTP